MKTGKLYVAVALALLIWSASAENISKDAGCTKDHENHSKTVLEFGRGNVLGEITGGEISDSRMAGIGVLLMLIATTLYAGFS